MDISNKDITLDCNPFVLLMAISLCVLVNANAILVEENKWYYLTIAEGSYLTKATLATLYNLFSIIYNFNSSLKVRICLLYCIPFSEDITVSIVTVVTLILTFSLMSSPTFLVRDLLLVTSISFIS